MDAVFARRQRRRRHRKDRINQSDRKTARQCCKNGPLIRPIHTALVFNGHRHFLIRFDGGHCSPPSRLLPPLLILLLLIDVMILNNNTEVLFIDWKGKAEQKWKAQSSCGAPFPAKKMLMDLRWSFWRLQSISRLCVWKCWNWFLPFYFLFFFFFFFFFFLVVNRICTAVGGESTCKSTWNWLMQISSAQLKTNSIMKNQNQLLRKLVEVVAKQKVNVQGQGRKWIWIRPIYDPKKYNWGRFSQKSIWWIGLKGGREPVQKLDEFPPKLDQKLDQIQFWLSPKIG